MILNEDECAAAGVDPRAVAALARRLEKAAREAAAIGLTVFGGTGSGDLRFHDGDRGSLIVAHMEGSWDGGDGGNGPSADGLIRGETAR